LVSVDIQMKNMVSLFVHKFHLDIFLVFQLFFSKCEQMEPKRAIERHRGSEENPAMFGHPRSALAGARWNSLNEMNE